MEADRQSEVELDNALFGFRFLLTLIVIQERRNTIKPTSERNRKMKEATFNTIQAILKADVTVTEEQATSILRCCKQTKVRRRLINAREACTILDCSRPTLRALVKQGHLQQINFSSRKARFDAEEVQRFANNGASAEKTEAADRP
jgi:excisionase family DNA binding protein